MKSTQIYVDMLYESFTKYLIIFLMNSGVSPRVESEVDQAVVEEACSVSADAGCPVLTSVVVPVLTMLY